MPLTPANAAIASRIKKILERGVDLSPDAIRFIDSTFAGAAAADLTHRLGSGSDSDVDSLIELLLSPDEALQLELEELLDELGPLEADADGVAEVLCCPAFSVEFRLPGNRGAISIVLTPDRLQRFLRPLRIDRSLPRPLIAASKSHLSFRDRLRLRVLLRGARFNFIPSFDDLLSRLIEGLDWKDLISWESFAFALELLAGLDAEADLLGVLAARKRHFLRALDHGRRQREQMAAANMEILLSRGHRLSYVDEPAIQRQLIYVDCICLAAFGRIIHLDTFSPGEALAFNGPPDVEDLIRRLS
jgi:hypothetical protein